MEVKSPNAFMAWLKGEDRIAIMDLIPGDRVFHEGSVCQIFEVVRFDDGYREVKFKVHFRAFGGINKWKVFRAGTKLRYASLNARWPPPAAKKAAKRPLCVKPRIKKEEK